MAFNYQISITAVSRVEEVIARIEKLFESINSAMDKVNAANRKVGEGAKTAVTAMQGLGDAAEEAGRKGVNMANAIAFGMVKAQAAIGLVSTAVTFLKGKFMEASDIQLQNISASSTFASLTGSSYEEAAKFTDRFNARISEAAATLPGSTAGYAQLARVIGDSVLPAFKDASGAVDMKGYEEGLFQLVQSYGAVAAGGGIDIGNTALGLTKAFMGSSTAELRQIQIFEQNPVILNYIEDELKKKGASAFRDVSEADRLKILTEAAKQMVTSDFVKRSSESVSGLMEGFNSALFDPSTGLLGVFRDLDAEAEGSQTAFQSFNDLLVRILGSEGVFGELVKFLQAMNLPDPMRVVKQGLDFAVGVLDQIIRVMKDINILIDSGYNVFQIIRYLFTGYFTEFTSFPDFIKGTIDRFLDAAETLILSFDGELIGRQLAQGLNDLVRWFGSLFSSFLMGGGSADPNQFGGRLGMIISDFIFQLFIGLGSFFANLSAETWGAIALAAMGAYLIPALFSSIGVMLAKVLALNTIGAVAGPVFSTFIGGMIAKLAAVFGITVVGTAPGLLILALVATFAMLGKVIWDHKDQIAEHMQPFIDPLIKLFALLGKMLELIGAMLRGDINGIKTAASGIMVAAKALIESIVNQFKAAYDALVVLMNPILQVLGQPQMQTTGQMAAAAADRRSQMQLGAAMYGVRGRWQGWIPNAIPAFNGLFSAIAAEAANMPSGAQLAIANTSEAILTPTMLRNLVRNSVSAGVGASASTPAPNITFNINGAKEPQVVAQEVIGLLEQWLSDYMQGQLT